ncbi:MAG: DNA-deoxyinosine glycosylase [Firmicutes bacterium]|nr:DNA-deoxyinosine glycosylase [Bacillota bacterium]
MNRETHNIDPVYDSGSRILILGSFPSVKSREAEFFYAHPQNRFWRVIAAVCGCGAPESVNEKREMLLNNHIALWDVIKSCEIDGSSDSSIKAAEVNDFERIFSAAPIAAVFANGSAAHALYRRYVGENITRLPSTSPANAAWSIDRLIGAWSVIREYIR